MLTVHSAPPKPILKPFIRAYVQREARLGNQELVEPVVARLGVMLELNLPVLTRSVTTALKRWKSQTISLSLAHRAGVARGSSFEGLLNRWL